MKLVYKLILATFMLAAALPAQAGEPIPGIDVIVEKKGHGNTAVATPSNIKQPVAPAGAPANTSRSNSNNPIPGVDIVVKPGGSAKVADPSKGGAGKASVALDDANSALQGVSTTR